MSLAKSMESLKKIDLNDLDFNNIGAWPGALKVIVLVVVLAALLGAGYQFHLKNLQTSLEQARAQEQSLRTEFTSKSFRAANLDAYKAQLVEIEERFGSLLRQLPSDTEVPGLLEDITQIGLNSGLEFESITLGQEVAQQFYIELPINIVVQGSYHDLGTFVSGVSSLPRIVTLHDFDIAAVKDAGSSQLKMNILAKTYRYSDTQEAQ